MRNKMGMGREISLSKVPVPFQCDKMGISFDVQAFMIQVGGMWVTQSVPWSITSMKRDQDKILEMRTSNLRFFPIRPTSVSNRRESYPSISKKICWFFCHLHVDVNQDWLSYTFNFGNHAFQVESFREHNFEYLLYIYRS